MSPQNELESRVFSLCKEIYHIYHYGINLENEDEKLFENFISTYQFADKHSLYWYFCNYEVWYSEMIKQKDAYLKKFRYSRDTDFYLEIYNIMMAKKYHNGDLVFPDTDNIFSLDDINGLRNEVHVEPSIKLKSIVLDQEFYRKVYFTEREKKEYLEEKLKGLLDAKKENNENLSLTDAKGFSYANNDTLNFKDRYYMLEKLGYLEHLVQSDILKKGKIRLLHLLLGCTETYAKELLNGKYVINKERVDELNKYINTIKNDYFK